MSLKARRGGEDFKPIPAGMHHAVCYSIVDVGTHYSEMDAKWKPQVVITWELPNERMDNGKPLSISTMSITNSTDERATLRKYIEGWIGRPMTEVEAEEFDLTTLLGRNCLLQVFHRSVGSKIYPNIKAVVPLMAGMPIVVAENPLRVFDIDSPVIGDDMPTWLRTKIIESREWKERAEKKDSPPPPPPPPQETSIEEPY